jgi:hypothetical protein
MTRVVFYHKGSEEVEFLHCHCEEGAEARDAAIHRVTGRADGYAVRLLRVSGSPRAFVPRDDKGGKVHSVCHCEEGAEARDAAIHRVSDEADGVGGSLTGSQWIASPHTGTDDDKGEGVSGGEIKK